jgi:hypothetical protein
VHLGGSHPHPSKNTIGASWVKLSSRGSVVAVVVVVVLIGIGSAGVCLR